MARDAQTSLQPDQTLAEVNEVAISGSTRLTEIGADIKPMATQSLGRDSGCWPKKRGQLP